MHIFESKSEIPVKAHPTAVIFSNFGGMANNNSFFFLLIKSEAVGSEITRDSKTSSSKKGFTASHIEEKNNLKRPSSQGFYKIIGITLKKITLFFAYFHNVFDFGHFLASS